MKCKIEKVKTSLYIKYIVFTRRENDTQFHSRLELNNAEEMRQIAKVLIEKADEIDPQIIEVCPNCDNDHLTDLTTDDDRYLPEAILYCDECECHFTKKGIEVEWR